MCSHLKAPLHYIGRSKSLFTTVKHGTLPYQILEGRNQSLIVVARAQTSPIGSDSTRLNHSQLFHRYTRFCDTLLYTIYALSLIHLFARVAGHICSGKRGHRQHVSRILAQCRLLVCGTCCRGSAGCEIHRHPVR